MNSLFSSSFTITKPKFQILAAIPQSHHLSRLAKTATTAVASAALFLSSIHSPALAEVSPIPTITTTTTTNTETLTDAEKQQIVEEFYSSLKTGKTSFSDLIGLVLCKCKNDADATAMLDRLKGDEAEKEYKILLKKDPSERRNRRLKEVKMLMGQAWIIEGKYKDSCQIFEEIVKEEKSDCRPHLCLGIVYTLLGKNDEAEKQFQNYWNLVPKRNRNAKYLDEDILAIKELVKGDEKIKRKELLRCCFARIEHELNEGWFTFFTTSKC